MCRNDPVCIAVLNVMCMERACENRSEWMPVNCLPDSFWGARSTPHGISIRRGYAVYDRKYSECFDLLNCCQLRNLLGYGFKMLAFVGYTIEKYKVEVLLDFVLSDYRPTRFCFPLYTPHKNC